MESNHESGFPCLSVKDGTFRKAVGREAVPRIISAISSVCLRFDRDIVFCLCFRCLVQRYLHSVLDRRSEPRDELDEIGLTFGVGFGENPSEMGGSEERSGGGLRKGRLHRRGYLEAGGSVLQ